VHDSIPLLERSGKSFEEELGFVTDELLVYDELFALLSDVDGDEVLTEVSGMC
jgi:hypothetical protein